MKQQSDKERLDRINDASSGADTDDTNTIGATEDTIEVDGGDTPNDINDAPKVEVPVEENLIISMFNMIWDFIQSFMSPSVQETKTKGLDVEELDMEDVQDIDLSSGQEAKTKGLDVEELDMEDVQDIDLSSGDEADLDNNIPGV